MMRFALAFEDVHYALNTPLNDQEIAAFRDGPLKDLQSWKGSFLSISSACLHT